jgi:hypothetical protein
VKNEKVVTAQLEVAEIVNFKKTMCIETPY